MILPQVPQFLSKIVHSIFKVWLAETHFNFHWVSLELPGTAWKGTQQWFMLVAWNPRNAVTSKWAHYAQCMVEVLWSRITLGCMQAKLHWKVLSLLLGNDHITCISAKLIREVSVISGGMIDSPFPHYSPTLFILSARVRWQEVSYCSVMKELPQTAWKQNLTSIPKKCFNSQEPIYL